MHLEDFGIDTNFQAESCNHKFIVGKDYEFPGFRGTCHVCNKPITILEKIPVTFVETNTIGIALVHIFTLRKMFFCKNCGSLLYNIAIYCDPKYTIYPVPNQKEI